MPGVGDGIPGVPGTGGVPGELSPASSHGRGLEVDPGHVHHFTDGKTKPRGGDEGKAISPSSEGRPSMGFQLLSKMGIIVPTS